MGITIPRAISIIMTTIIVTNFKVGFIITIIIVANTAMAAIDLMID